MSGGRPRNLAQGPSPVPTGRGRLTSYRAQTLGTHSQPLQRPRTLDEAQPNPTRHQLPETPCDQECPSLITGGTSHHREGDLDESVSVHTRVSVRVCPYACVHVFTCMHTYRYVRIYICVWARVSVCVRVYVVYVSLSPRTRVCVWVSTCTSVCVCIRVFM